MTGDFTIDFCTPYNFDELKIIETAYVNIICKQHVRCAKKCAKYNLHNNLKLKNYSHFVFLV